MVKKAPDAFRTISEAAKELDLPAHVLRHWEETFGAIRPMRRAGGRRYYRLHDLEILGGVRALLHGERYTTKGVQKFFKDHGTDFVAQIGRLVIDGHAPHAAVAHALKDAPSSPAPCDEQVRHLKTQLLALKEAIADLRQAASASEKA